jgi:hypothetical protein
LAELEVFQNLFNVKMPFDARYIPYTNNNGNFSSLDEAYKCAVLEAFQILIYNDAGSFQQTFQQTFQICPKDGSTRASTKFGKLCLLSKIHILINNHLENINIIIIKVPTDECYEHMFSSIRTKMAELEPTENLEVFYTSNYIYNIEAKAILA